MRSDRERIRWVLKVWRKRSAARKTGASSPARPLCRRHQAAGHDPRAVHPQPACACQGKSIDSSAAMKMPGVVGVLTGQQIVDDKVGNLICGWAITSKDGTPDEDGRVAGDGAGNGALCRTGGRGSSLAETRTRPRMRPKPSSSIMRSFRWRPISAPRSADAPTASRKPRANVIYDWTIGDEAATEQHSNRRPTWSPRHHHNRLVRMRWSRARRARNTTTPERAFTLYTTSQNPHVARLVLSAFYNIAQEHKLRVVAPVSRRFRLENLSSIRKKCGAVGPPRRCGAR